MQVLRVPAKASYKPLPSLPTLPTLPTLPIPAILHIPAKALAMNRGINFQPILW